MGLKLFKISAVAVFLGLGVAAVGAQPVPGSAASPAVTTVGPPPTTQNTVTTTGPVTSSTTIEAGTMAGQAVLWVVAVFGTAIGGVATKLIYTLAQSAGLKLSEGLRDKIQDTIVNGLNVGAAEVAKDAAGKGQIQIKNEIVAKAVTYAQTHGADTLKALGEDPASQKAIDAIKARIETAIADPSQPTPAVLDKPPVAVVPPVAGA